MLNRAEYELGVVPASSEFLIGLTSFVDDFLDYVFSKDEHTKGILESLVFELEQDYISLLAHKTAEDEKVTFLLPKKLIYDTQENLECIFELSRHVYIPEAVLSEVRDQYLECCSVTAPRLKPVVA